MVATGHLAVGAVALAAAMVVLAVTGVRHAPSRWVLALLGVVWLAIDQGFEGPTLLVLDPGRGLTASDLVGVAAVVVACGEGVAGVALRRLRPRRGRRPGGADAPAPSAPR